MKRRKPSYTILRDLRKLIEKYDNECASMGISGTAAFMSGIVYDLTLFKLFRRVAPLEE